MTEENKIILANRFKSFVWRTAMMVVAGLLAFATESLNSFDIAPSITVVAGLVLGEVTKYINTKISQK